MENKSSYQINEQGVLGEVKIADDVGDCVPADGGHGLQNQQSCLWKQTAAHKTPVQGQRTGQAVSLWGW